jgi:hypothetical protein
MSIDGAKLAGALRALAAAGGTGSVISFVMSATDSFLFAMVPDLRVHHRLGFCDQPLGRDRERLPAWMRIASVGELKHTLVQWR